MLSKFGLWSFVFCLIFSTVVVSMTRDGSFEQVDEHICTICIDAQDDEKEPQTGRDEFMTLPCLGERHTFHRRCLVEWFTSQIDSQKARRSEPYVLTCPNCRKAISFTVYRELTRNTEKSSVGRLCSQLCCGGPRK